MRIARRFGQPIAVVAGLLPLAHLGLLGAADRLGANPIESITHATGDWALRLLLASLAVTPIRRLTGWNGLIRFRRTLGLLAFGYVSIHLLTYLWLDQFFDLPAIARDIARRPFITAGTAAFVLLVPLALTSTAAMIRRLGGRAWRRLHRLVYGAAALAVIHYWWLVKADITRPLAYAIILVALLGVRAWLAFGRARPATTGAGGGSSGTAPGSPNRESES